MAEPNAQPNSLSIPTMAQRMGQKIAAAVSSGPDTPGTPRFRNYGMITSQNPDAAANLLVTPPPSGPTISARPSDGVFQKAANWFEDLGEDIRHGTTLTAPGRALHAMGAKGTEYGAPPAVSEFMASPQLGLTRVAQGAAEIPAGQVKKGVGDIAGGVLQAGTIPGAFAGAANPSVAIRPLVQGAVAQQAATRTARAMGASPQTQETVGDVAALVGGGLGLGHGAETIPSESELPPPGRPEPNPEIQALANDYNAQRGAPPVDHGNYAPLNEDFSRNVAHAYEGLKPDNSADPRVAAAYRALGDEINAQWDHATANGIQFEPWTRKGQPYQNSTEMANDVANNKHLYFFQGGEPHPLLGDIDPETGLSMNDKFRAVHDLYGHAAGGYGFGPRGEEGAWRVHSQMFSPEAVPAMTTETRGQNSWVNFGEHNYGPNGEHLNIPPPDRPFAQQKVDLLPPEYLARTPDVRRVSIGLDTGEGTPLRQAGITTIPREAVDPIVNEAARRNNVGIVDRASGLGAYLTSTEPSTHLQVVGEPQNIDNFMHTLGHALQQTEVISTRPGSPGNGYAFDVFGDGLGNDEERGALFHDLRARLGDQAGIIPGFQPIEKQGVPGLRFLNFDGPLNNSDIINLKSAVGDAASGRGYDLNVAHGPIDITSTTNDWRQFPDGQAYRSRLMEAGRPDISDWLDSERGRLGEAQASAGGSAAATAGPSGLAETPTPPAELQGAPGGRELLPAQPERGAQGPTVAHRMGQAIWRTLQHTGISVPVEGQEAAARGMIGEGGTVVRTPDVQAPPPAAPDWVTEGDETPGPHTFGIHIPEGREVGHPGIYDVPNTVAAASEMVAPESPNLKRLFGVTRDDLWNISQQGRRPGNITERPYRAAINPKGAKHAPELMTPENTQRIHDILEEASQYPDLYRSMASWYVMDPVYQRMAELHGENAIPAYNRFNAIPAYNRFNAITSMASPMSDVVTELQRGTGANWMHELGRFEDFRKYGGIPPESRPRAVRKLMMDIPGHMAHSTAQAPAMQKYLQGIGVDMGSAKVPSYIMASGVPETGFQTIYPVGDAHWSAGLGLRDVRPMRQTKFRQDAGPGGSASTPEMTALTPWYQSIALEHGIQPVPAQAIQWGALAPATGVESQIGAPKIEILADQIAKRAAKLGISPEEMRDRVLTFRDMVTLPPVGLGIGAAGAGAAGAVAAADQRADEYREQ